jgi:putative two-component system response regulator
MTSPGKERPTILLVDDVPENLSILANFLGVNYRTKASTSGHRAIEIAKQEPQPDLILLDVMMSDLNGFEVCRRLKALPETENIPIIFLTAQTDPEAEQEGLDLGAVDYITKPFSPPTIVARINTQLHLKSVRDFLVDKTIYLEQEVLRRTKEIALIQDISMVALGSLAETRDNETGSHIRRTQVFMKLLATEACNLPEFHSALPQPTIDVLYKSAALHDIGKVGIPDHILMKPDRLTESEFEIMKTHTSLGVKALQAAEKQLNTTISFLQLAMDIAGSHHERWDGAGYPFGLSGESIPLAGRLMALADVYDALRSERVYKPAFPHAKAVEIITGSVGQFDPRLLRIFYDSSNQWARAFDEIGM